VDQESKEENNIFVVNEFRDSRHARLSSKSNTATSHDRKSSNYEESITNIEYLMRTRREVMKTPVSDFEPSSATMFAKQRIFQSAIFDQGQMLRNNIPPLQQSYFGMAKQYPHRDPFIASFSIKNQKTPRESNG